MDEFAAVVACSDCGASNPSWASLNHGVLICSDCCFVHINLGRHISQIRSLTKGIWSEKQLALLNFLNNNGANNIWEHALIDPNGGSTRTKKKPVSNDPIIPKKETFITAKYAHLAYTIRPAKDEFSIDDLNRQLWSCVRTGHVETTLRLLALGASPDYADPEKGNAPLHIAAKEGQSLQVELLWLYGADVGQRNAAGLKPSELAKQEGHISLSERLIELDYEITDRFSLFLCGRKPSHKENQHFIIPDLVDTNRTMRVKKFRQLIQESSGVVLERMVQDVYDEVDRRELNTQWVSVTEHFRLGAHQHVAMFLPPNPTLSATRNQLRQKLAKFSSADFAHLLIDLLKEIHRRHYKLAPANPETNRDQCALEKEWTRKKVSSIETHTMNKSQRISSNDTRSTILDEMTFGLSPLDYYLELKEKWMETNEKLEQFSASNTQILRVLQQLQKTVEQLQMKQADIHHELDIRKQQNCHSISSPPTMRPATPPPLIQSVHTMSSAPLPQVGAFIMSTSTLIRPSQQNKAVIHKYSTDTYPSAKMSIRPSAVLSSSIPSSTNTSRALLPLPPLHHSPHNQSTTSMPNTIQQKQTKVGSQPRQTSLENSNQFTVEHTSLEKTNSFMPLSNSKINTAEVNHPNHPDYHIPLMHSNESRSEYKMGQTVPPKNADKSLETSNDFEMRALFSNEVFPDNLILETELLTNAIKALLSDLQSSTHQISSRNSNIEANALFHADSVNHHIIHILSVIPTTYMRSTHVQKCAIGMETAMKQLSRRCLARPLCVDSTCQAAYDVAKAAKELLVTVHAKEEQS